MSNSTKSWEDATRKGVKKVSESLNDVKSAYVQDQSVVVENGKVKEYRVSLKISFLVK